MTAGSASSWWSIRASELRSNRRCVTAYGPKSGSATAWTQGNKPSLDPGAHSRLSTISRMSASTSVVRRVRPNTRRSPEKPSDIQSSVRAHTLPSARGLERHRRCRRLGAHRFAAWDLQQAVVTDFRAVPVLRFLCEKGRKSR